ncbi:MAG: ABC-F family ATP-binding cassette domain-containing protein [Magnetococcales bacterium]|nr:ABC-F family ATP-binding cassette domain-containing protein [Magnetococcales bacterium]NGZ26199.1 ABC-F family ATP-binding cassette domain-containing protein [Magnetococcales bacterium]
MLRFDEVSKSFGVKVIVEKADLVIHSGERVGLIGANGVGKTTVMRMITGEMEWDGGEISQVGAIRIGVLKQELTHTDHSILQTTLAGHHELISLRHQRNELRHALEMDASQQDLVHQLGEVECRLETLGTYDAEARAGAILQGLGFAPQMLEEPVSAFSGGWRMRVALAQALFAEPDLLLLDEPTNHLDLESVAWLEGFLSQWRGGLLMISHNRSFLNRVVQVIVELANGQLTRYVGNFDRYLEQKAAWLEQQQKSAAQQQLRVEALERFIRRFRAKATKARQVQSRIKALNRLERVEVAEDKKQAPIIRLPPAAPCHRQMLNVQNMVYSYGEQPVFQGATFSIQRGDKIGLLGVNGSGKSTLLKLAAGSLQAGGGKWQVGEGVKAAYFTQHSLESLQPEHTVLESLEAAVTDSRPQSELRSLLGGFLFSGEDAFKPVSVLSGGERARLALARLFVSGANLLLLDEPTNHLDMEARAALADALESYGGTLLVVSHDQDVLESVCEQFWLVGEGKVTPWEGELQSYLTESSQRRSVKSESNSSNSGGNRRDTRRQWAELREEANRRLRPLRSQLSQLEEKIHRWETEQKELETFLASASAYEEGQRNQLARSVVRNGELTTQLHEAMGQWETLSHEIDQLEQELKKQLAK